jgi:hypothetical protein
MLTSLRGAMLQNMRARLAEVYVDHGPLRRCDQHVLDE